ncbi:hypothetical protein [Streptomyces sp. NPDC001744]
MPTEREAVRQSWIDRNFRSFLGVDPPRIHEQFMDGVGQNGDPGQ